MPYESVSSQIQNIAHRTSLDSLIFPVDHLVPLVCAYAINNGQDATIGADPSWPVLLFLNLGVPYALIVHMLEEIFDTQEQPFLGRKRKLVVQWINTAVEAWIREVERRGTAGKGGDGAISGWVSDLLVRAEECLVQLSAGGRANADAEEIVETRRTVRSLKRMVDQIAGADRQGSLFGR